MKSYRVDYGDIFHLDNDPNLICDVWEVRNGYFRVKWRDDGAVSEWSDRDIDLENQMNWILIPNKRMNFTNLYNKLSV